MSIAIVHYLPLEFYPPVTNLLDLLDDTANGVHVFTTHNDRKRKVYGNSALKIHRYALPGKEGALTRLYKYMAFNLGVFYRLMKIRPKAILYYETYSAYPVYLYKKFIDRKVPVYIHCHEYFPPQWYQQSMRLLRHYHRQEKKLLYPSAQWISQTNAQRAELFLNDHPYLRKEQLQVLPNYPPARWSQQVIKGNKVAGKTRCVYIGSLSTEDTYIVEFCEWVKKQASVEFDIYSYNMHDSARQYLKNLNVENIRFFESGLEYENIPAVLANYDVGIIFYKATTLNFRYNAPNKLFEYLSCGLDVWFSKEMLGCYDYIREDAHPLILKIDFAQLGSLDHKKAMQRDDLPRRQQHYSAATVLQPLIGRLKSIS
jgi:hypothetical protein